MTALIDRLASLVVRNHRDLMSLGMVANQIDQNNRLLHVGRRMDRQVDMLWKAKCPDYQPPEEEEDMGTNIQAGVNVYGNEAIQMLAQELANDNQEEPKASAGEGATQTREPNPSVPTPPEITLLKKLLPWLAIPAAIGGGIIGSWMFDTDTDTDTRNTVKAVALPYEPDQPGDDQ